MRHFRSLNAQAWLIFTLLTVCYGLASFFRTSPSTLAVDIMRDFSVGGGLMAVMSSAFFYPYAFMQIPAGILSDRWGPRNTICLFLLLGAAGLANMWEAVFADVGVSVIAILNAMRALRVEDGEA